MVGWGVTYLSLQAGNGILFESSPIHRPTAATAGKGSPAEQISEVDGKAVFIRTCAACHQASGVGVPGAFPPLTGSEWVNGDKMIPIKIVLKGLHQEISVKGQIFNGMMPALEAVLKDDEIAAVVKYIRSSWENKNTEFATTEDVAKTREELKTRTNPWTASDLKQ